MGRKKAFLVSLFLASFLYAYEGWIPLGEGYSLEVKILRESSQGLTLEISVPGVQISEKKAEGRVYQVLTIPEAGILTEIGRPQLPVITKLVALPSSGGIEVEILEIEKKELRGEYVLYPFQKPPHRGEGELLEPDGPFLKEESIYSSERPFPPRRIEVRDPVILRDVRIAPVLFFPVEYTPQTGRVQVATRMKVRLSYRGRTSNPKMRLNSGLSPSFVSLYERFLLNYKNIYGTQSVQDGSYLIIVYDDFYDEALNLANWRAQQGVEVHLVKGTDISDPPTFNAIYNYVYNAYYNWSKPPEYLLLIGDADQIPPGTGLTGFASDHKYATVEGNDYLPDIHVARLPVNTDASASYVIGKILNYELNPNLAETDWYRKIVTISGSDYVDDQNANRCGTIAVQCGGFTHIDSLWASLGRNTLTNALNAFNEGRSFTAYFGHGTETAWTSTNPPFTTSTVQSLSNYNKLPVIMDIACSNSAFDYTGGDCFSEAWMKVGSPGQERGAIAIYGATTLSPFFYTDTLGRGFFLGYFCDSLRHYGEAADYAKLYMYQYFPEPPGGTTEETMQMHDPFGDPYQMFWTAVPASPLVDFPPTVPMGPSIITVTVEWPDASPVRGALVSAMQAGVVFDAGTTDVTGSVGLSINPTTPDSIVITVSAHNLIPFVGTTMPISSGPYVVHLGHTIDDSDGNGDGVVNPGENILLPTWVKNWGNEEAFGVSGLLSTDDPFATVTQDSAFFGDIGAGDSALSSPPYAFQVSPSCTNGHVISFALSTSDDSGSQWISTFPVQVCAPQVNAESLIVDDSGGVDPNGMLDPGETANLIAVLENSGCAGLTDLNLSITTTSPYLTIVDGVASLPELPPETTITNESDPFVVEASPSTPYGEEISILLNVTASGGFDESYSLLLIVGRGGNFLVWDPDQNHNSGTLIRDILDSLGYRGFYWDGSDLGEYRDILDNFQSVFVCVGVYPNNHVIQSGSADAQALSDYLTNGGKMYLEGGDVWYYDPLYQGGYNFAPLFGLNAYADGSGDMGTLEGLSGTFTEGMSFPYGGENNWMDHIQQQASGSFNIFRNLSPFYYCGVAYDNGTRRTVGTSFELGGLNDGPPPSTKAALLDSIMHFFGIYQNLPPNGFSLIEPQDGDTTSLPLLLDWEDAEDPNPGDVVVYDLYISLSENFSPESTIIYADLSESQYTLTSLPEIAKGKLPFKKKSQLRQNMGIPGVDPVSSSRTDGSKREISGGSPGIAQEDEYNFYHWKVLARDNYGGETWSNQTWTFLLPACQMGDANGDGSVDMNDLTFLANYIFQSGPEPTPCADMNGDGIIDGNDLTMLANYLFGREGKSNTPGMKKKDIQGKVTN